MTEPARSERSAEPAELEFWFDLASNYSYVSAMRLPQLAAAAGVTVRWQPFLLGPIFADFGWSTSPFVLQPQKGAYVWQDMRRQCRKHGLPWQPPSQFPRNSVLATRVALYGAGAPWQHAFVQAIARGNFGYDADIAREDVIVAALDALGAPAADILAACQGDAHRAALRAQTARARALGIFGAPTFVVDGELFWGNDRLEDAIEEVSSRRDRAAAGA